MTDLPSSWASVRLSDLGPWIGGGTPSKANPAYWNGPIPWVSPKDMKAEVLSNTIDGITEEAVECSSAKRVPPNSVLIVTRSGILAHSLPVATTTVETALNQDLKALSPPLGICPDYLAWALRSCEQRILNTCRKGGTTVHSIEMPRLSAFELPIAPTNEQRRIVERIEALFDEIDRGVESLRTARTTIDLYRQSLLKSAFEGRLTAGWRVENADNLERPDALLTRIRKERARRYEAALGEWEEATARWRAHGEQGKKPAKPTRPKSTQAVSNDRLAVPPAWATAPLCGIAFEAVLGKMLDRQKNRGEPRVYLGNINLRWGSFDVDSEKKIPIEDHEVPRYGVRAGDLIICEGGEPGRCAVWDGGSNQVFIQKALHRVRFTRSYSSRFAYFFFRFAAVAGLLESHYTGSTIKHLTGRALAEVLLPICSPPEQLEVVRTLESHLEAAAKLDAEIDANLVRSEALRQSILRRAFSGQLVPQDQADEPASALLARVRAERAGVSATERLKRATTASG